MNTTVVSLIEIILLPSAKLDEENTANSRSTSCVASVANYYHIIGIVITVGKLPCVTWNLKSPNFLANTIELPRGVYGAILLLCINCNAERVHRYKMYVYMQSLEVIFTLNYRYRQFSEYWDRWQTALIGIRPKRIRNFAILYIIRISHSQTINLINDSKV